MNDPDPHHLARFVEAQADTFETALAEIRRGAKRSHWMWYLFPQVAGLGRSETARYYAIATVNEAQAYLADPVLGPRLRACLSALEDVTVADATRVFGAIDAIKLRSSLTLFEAAGGGAAFGEALDRWFGGRRDPATLKLLA